MYVFGAILAVIILFGFIRVHLVAEYDEAGFDGFLQVFSVKIRFPAKNKKAQSDIKTSVSKKDEKKHGSLKTFRNIITPALKAVGKLIRAIQIKKLVADIKVAGEDAFSTAMMYGGATAAIGILYPLLDSNLKIKKKTISVSADFEADESVIYFYTDVSINIWQTIAVATYFIYQFLKKAIYENKKQKGIR